MRVLTAISTILVPNLITWFIGLLIDIFREGYYYKKKKNSGGSIDEKYDFVNKFIFKIDLVWKFICDKAHIKVYYSSLHLTYSVVFTLVQFILFKFIILVINKIPDIIILFESYSTFFYISFGIIAILILTYLLGRIVSRNAEL
jgi:hypothetical protein